MNESTPYSINTDVRFGPLQRIDVRQLAGACKHSWFNQILCGVNDCVVRLGVLKGEFHWHKHDIEDEFFYVVEGTLIVEYDDRRVTLGPHQGITVPRGLLHRTSAPERTVVLMVEGSGVKPTGD